MSDQDMENAVKRCKCGKWMIQRSTGEILTSFPAYIVMQWWCGGCGNTERADPVKVYVGETDLERWRNAQSNEVRK